MKTRLLSLFAIAPLFLFAQNEGNLSTSPPPPAPIMENNLKSMDKNSPSVAANAILFDGRYEGAINTSWLWEAWLPGEIYMTGGRHIPKGLQFKYDAAKNELHVRSTKDTTQEKILVSEEVISVNLESGVQKQMMRRVSISGQDSNQLYLQLYTGSKYELLLLAEKKLKKADYKHPLSQDKRYDEWILHRKYFLKTGSQYKKIKLNRGDLKKALPKSAALELETNTYDDVTEAEAVVLLKKLETPPAEKEKD